MKIQVELTARQVLEQADLFEIIEHYRNHKNTDDIFTELGTSTLFEYIKRIVGFVPVLDEIDNLEEIADYLRDHGYSVTLKKKEVG